MPLTVRAAVVINEVFYDPDKSSDTGKEYIILYNNGDSPYALNNHCLYASGEHYIFKSFTLEPKRQIIIHWNVEGTDTSTDLYTGKTNWSNMGDSSGSVALFLNHDPHSSSNILDFIQYIKKETWESIAVKAEIWTVDAVIAGVPVGRAIKLKTDGVDNNLPGNWMEATPSITQEESGSSSSSQQSSQSSGGTSNNQLPIADAGDNTIAFIDEEINFDGSKSHDPDGFDLAYEWNLGEGGIENDVKITHKYSYPGTYLVSLTVFDDRYYVTDTIIVNIYPKKITISEFLPSPIGKDEEEEWVEIYNDSDLIADISGWQLDDEDGGSEPFVFPKNTLIAPNSYLVFPRQITGIALNNDKDKVRLLLSNGTIFQEINYEKAPKGQSSAKTPEGFVWSMPTPGLPNIISVEEQKFSYKEPLLSETTKQPSENMNLKYNLENSNKVGLIESSESKNQNPESQNYYNLADLEKSADNGKLTLIIITIIVITLSAGIGFLKLKKKI